MNRPIKHCYWVVPGKLLAGEYPRNMDDESSQDKIDALLGSGITAFIDLTEVDEGLLPYTRWLQTASHNRFAIPDYSIPVSEGDTIATLDAIDSFIQQGHMVYVHCWGGIGRTGVIVGCWLARHGFVGQDALDRLGELWLECPKSAYRTSPETSQQEEYIRNWKAGK